MSQNLLVVYCAFCPTWQRQGDPETTLAAQHQHRQNKHPNLAPTRRKKRKFNTKISDKNVEQNIAAVREQGGATWVRKVA